jgi:tetratricopeptide (TPR) repeat protein
MTTAIRGILYGKAYDFPKKSLAYELLEVIKSNGIEDGMEFYNLNKKSDTYELNENEINQIGYQLMGTGKIEEAEQVFKLNIDSFPKSSNAYDSYAEALMNLGKNDLAIENYRKSVELNPNNQNGIDNLKKLGTDVSDLIKEIVVPDHILESYIGKYELMPNFILTVTKENHQMRAQATGQPAFDIFPKSENEFYLKVVNAQLTFNTNDKGNVVSVTLHQGGQDIEGKKID